MMHEAKVASSLCFAFRLLQDSNNMIKKKKKMRSKLNRENLVIDVVERPCNDFEAVINFR